MLEIQNTTESLDLTENSAESYFETADENIQASNLDSVMRANFFGLNVITLERENNKAFLDYDNKEWKHYDESGNEVSETRNLIGTGFEGLHRAITFDLLDKGYSISEYQENGENKAIIYTIDGSGNISFANVLLKEQIGNLAEVSSEVLNWQVETNIEKPYEEDLEFNLETDQEIEVSQRGVERLENRVTQSQSVNDNVIIAEPLQDLVAIPTETKVEPQKIPQSAKAQNSLNGITLIRL